MAKGPVEVQAACEAALRELSGAFATSGVAGSREQWASVLASAQRVVNAAGAVQDAAIARLASIEPEFLEDGTVVECHRALGHVALDAPAVVSGVLSVSAVHAQRRVRTAVRLAADGPSGSETATGLGGLHTAMASGRLDGYRAAVVAEELEHAPAQVAATVVAALEGHFGTDDGAHLRRRCRRVLTRISPDLLHQRAARARAQCGLRRWADEPGVDRWEGTFPSEEAARAWAAIDALARQYVNDGSCSGHRTGPGQGVDRPGRRQRHHRHDHHRDRPRRPPSRAPPSPWPLRPASRTPGPSRMPPSAPETMRRRHPRPPRRARTGSAP